jgi:MFS family permease
MLQGCGDSLRTIALISITNLEFSGTDKAKVLGGLQSMFGLGMIIGPAAGSMVYGAYGYQ